MIDLAITHAVQSYQPEWLTWVMRVASAASSTLVCFIAVPLAAAYFAWRGRRRLALATLQVAAGNAFTPILKELIARPRPTAGVVRVLEVQTNFSFPSGHAFAAAIFFGFFIWVTAHLRPRYYRLIIAVLAGLIFLVGYSRVYLGVHWASDVMAGYAFGALWLAAFTRGFHRTVVIDAK